MWFFSLSLVVYVPTLSGNVKLLDFWHGNFGSVKCNDNVQNAHFQTCFPTFGKLWHTIISCKDFMEIIITVITVIIILFVLTLFCDFVIVLQKACTCCYKFYINFGIRKFILKSMAQLGKCKMRGGGYTFYVASNEAIF